MKRFKKIFILLITFIGLPLIANAESASISINGDGSVVVGNNVTISFNINSVSSQVAAFGGKLNYDGSYLKLESCKSTSSLTYTSNGNNIAFVDFSATGIKSGSIGSCTFKTLKSGSASISMSGISASDSSSNSLSVSIGKKDITIKEPASTNNNLGSLSVSGCNISFSKGNTNYSCTVESTVTSVDVQAQVEDSKASLSGTGSKNLNFGSNKINVTVKAEDGSSKTYTINVTRKDNRSNDATLKSLKVSNGTLSPGFSSGTTSYTMEVPYSVSKLDIDAQTNDSNAKVSISNNSLVAEKTTEVQVKVTAENGATKTYTISVKRGKDPNKKLSTNNNLSSLSIDVGILSPVFDASKTNYIVYLPYEVTNINFSAEVSDTEYASIEWNKPENLGVGENIVEAKVKAEDESTKTYKIIVVRGASLDGEGANGSTDLKSLSIENGKLKTSFSNNIHFYTYKKGKEALKINAVANDINSTVNILNDGDIYTVLVESASGEKSVFILAPEEKTNMIIYIVIGIVALILILIIILLIIKNKKNKKEIKKIKEN